MGAAFTETEGHFSTTVLPLHNYHYARNALVFSVGLNITLDNGDSSGYGFQAQYHEVKCNES